MGDISGKAKQWKSYDDIFAGRTNKGGIDLVNLMIKTYLTNQTVFSVYSGYLM